MSSQCRLKISGFVYVYGNERDNSWKTADCHTANHCSIIYAELFKFDLWVLFMEYFLLINMRQTNAIYWAKHISHKMRTVRQKIYTDFWNFWCFFLGGRFQKYHNHKPGLTKQQKNQCFLWNFGVSKKNGDLIFRYLNTSEILKGYKKLP